MWSLIPLVGFLSLVNAQAGQNGNKQCVPCSGEQLKSFKPPKCYRMLENKGNRPEARSLLDSAMYWTMVDRNPFKKDGIVNKIQLNAAVTGRALRLGIYTPLGNCSFSLKQQTEFPGFPSGINTIDLNEDQQLEVAEGDHYGFTWLQQGSLTYEPLKPGNQLYCEDGQKFDAVGETADLVAGRYGNREYSLKVTAKPKCDDTCNECFCLDPASGAEIAGSRSTDPVDCTM